LRLAARSLTVAAGQGRRARAGTMGHDVFISYSSKNKAEADAVCVALEAAGVECWIAPRDTEAGAYGPSIIRAIKAARLCVLILSDAANASQHVLRELERAVNAKLPIVPLRLALVDLCDDMEYYIASQHWVDGFPGPPEAHIAELVARVKAKLGTVPPPPVPAAKAARRPGVGDRVERAMISLSRLPPPMTALALILLGMAVIGASLFIGIGHFSYTLPIDGRMITKEVGFLPALNWSLCALVVVPAMVAFGLHAYRNLPQLFEHLARRRMVVDEYLHPVSADVIADHWRRHARTVALLSALAVLVAICYSLWEYYDIVGRHYLAGRFPTGLHLKDAYQERDWSVASLLGTPDANRISRTANALFALFVYLVYSGLAAGFGFSIFIYLLGVSSFVYALAQRGDGIRMVPDLRGTDAAYDRRAGLQLFEPLIQNALFVALLCFLMLFLIHLQNIYLRAPQPDIIAFAFPAGSGQGGAVQWLEALAGTITSRVGLENLNSAMAYGFGSFLFIVVLVVLAMTLRAAAQKSRAFMAEYIADENASLPSWLQQAGREKCRARLAAMSMWPARWPRVNQLALAAVLAGLCLVFYKVGLILVVVALLLVGYRLLSQAARPG
jgi:hypothetical protein